MTKLCPRGKAAAKRKFKVYPSAYANAYASKICAGKIKDPSGTKRKDFRGPKPAGKAVGGVARTAGAQSALGRLQKSGLMKANKGGGADTGTVGEQRSRLGVLSNKVKRLGRRLKDTDRLTERDIEKAKDIIKNPRKKALNMSKRTIDILKSSKKQGGIMKYNKGGGADYMNTVKPRKRGNPAVVGKVKNLEKRKAGGALMILIGIGKKKKVSKKSQGGDAMDEYSQRERGEKRKALKTGDYKKYERDVLPKPKRLKLGGGAMEEKEKRKQGNKPSRPPGGKVGKPRGIMRRQSSYSGGGLARGGGAAIRGTKFEGIF
jgi:hypothetical protein